MSSPSKTARLRSTSTPGASTSTASSSSWMPKAPSEQRRKLGTSSSVTGRRSKSIRPCLLRALPAGQLFADQLHLALALVDVVAPVLQEGPAVGLGRRLGTGIGGRQSRLDALGRQALRLGDERLDHLVLGHDADNLALDEQMAPPPA